MAVAVRLPGLLQSQLSPSLGFWLDAPYSGAPTPCSHTIPTVPDVRERATDQQTISRGIVAIYKDFVGRGPTTAQTTITDAFVTTICRDTLTRAERTLVDSGDGDVVRGMRRKFQAAELRQRLADPDGKEMIRLVEQTTGRHAAAFLSDHDVEQDIAIETIVLVDF